MSSAATAKPQTSQRGNAGRGRRTNRGGKGRGGNPSTASAQSSAPAPAPIASQQAAVAKTDENAEEDEEDVCWICAEPVKYYSVSTCNHRTCHVCALRLRALYKKNDCTFCKEPQTSVIFTTSPEALYASFTSETVPFTDAKLKISFETQEMMEDTLILLRFNCPDKECDYIAKGWSDLKLHVRATHNKLMCDLCIRTKKVFAHEHALYTYAQLNTHLPSINDGRQRHKTVPIEQLEEGIHPLCEFCKECYYGNDELYAHMREKHEECFLCKRNDVRDQYFHNYAGLERHFNTVHYPCLNSTCQANKFVVFNSPIDLQGHMVDEHGTEMSARDRKVIQRIQADFEYEEVGGNRRGGRREQPPPRQQAQPPPPPAPGPSRPGGRRAGFGATLTDPAGGTSNRATPPGPSRRASPSPPTTDVDPATLERHSAFLSRLNSLAPNPTSAVPSVKAAIRGYRATETSARDLISTIFNVMDRHLEHTASVVNALIDLLEEEEKKQDLLSSWKGFDIEQRRQFPDLTPSAMGTGYSGIASGRVLNAKQTTASRSRHQTSNQVWDRVAQAASSSTPRPGSGPGPSNARVVPGSGVTSTFPPLRAPAPIASSSGQPAFRQQQRTTPWSASAARSAQPSPSNNTYNNGGGSSNHNNNNDGNSNSNSSTSAQQKPPSLSKSLFPDLPASGNTRNKPQINGNSSLRNILGTPSTPPLSAWAGASSQEGGAAGGSQEGGGSGGKGKKGKGKQKQTLFTLGSFPGGG